MFLPAEISLISPEVCPMPRLVEMYTHVIALRRRPKTKVWNSSSILYAGPRHARLMTPTIVQHNLWVHNKKRVKCNGSVHRPMDHILIIPKAAMLRCIYAHNEPTLQRRAWDKTFTCNKQAFPFPQAFSRNLPRVAAAKDAKQLEKMCADRKQIMSTKHGAGELQMAAGSYLRQPTSDLQATAICL